MEYDFDRATLVQLAIAMRERSYAPYSGMKVGAALLDFDGNVYGGCNIENASFSETICAERVAVAVATAAGSWNFAAIAVAGGPCDVTAAADDPLPELFYPCGACRQVLSEFCTPEMPVIVAKSECDWVETTLGDLLPESFTLN